MLNWQTDFPIRQVQMRFPNNYYAYTQTIWPDLNRIIVQTDIVEERELPLNSYQSYESAAAAGGYWARYKELGKGIQDAFAIAEKTLSKEIRGNSNCWMTVAKFDNASIDQWVRVALDHTETHQTQLGAQLPANHPTGPSKTSILAHEQGRFDITEAFAKVLRAELKTMHATVYSPLPKAHNPNQYREIARDLLHAQAMRRWNDLTDRMNNWQRQYHNVAGQTGNAPELQRIVARAETDPNCIMEPRVFPRSPNEFSNPNDLCDNGIVRTVV